MTKSNPVERALEKALFASRWLMAPFYMGLVVALVVLMIVFVHDIIVDEQCRGCGIADALLDAAFDWMRERGVARAMLWTASVNETARRLFERRGFRSTMVEMTKELGDNGATYF